jgi:sec-independent protein translocase protein TatB
MDFSWSEMMVVAIVALVVIGPKDLPGMFRELGRFTAKIRAMGREFSRAMEQAAKETGVKDVADDLKKVANPKAMGLDAVKSAADRFEKWDPLKNAARPSVPTPAAAAAATAVAPAVAEAAAAPAPVRGPETAALAEKVAARKTASAEKAKALRAAKAGPAADAPAKPPKPVAEPAATPATVKAAKPAAAKAAPAKVAAAADAAPARSPGRVRKKAEGPAGETA